MFSSFVVRIQMLRKTVNRIAGITATMLHSPSPTLTMLGLNATGIGSIPGFQEVEEKIEK